jgi:hypothetical protein
VEAQTTLVGAQSVAEFDAEATVDVDLALVVLPGHPEHDLAIRLAEPLDDLRLHKLRVLLEHGTQRSHDLSYRLVELGLAGILRDYLFANVLDVRLGIHYPLLLLTLLAQYARSRPFV